MARSNPPRLAAAVTALARAALRPERPDRLPRAMVAMAAWGPTMAGAIAASTARYPGAPAVIDDRGTLTFGELWAATDGIARGLRRRGVETTATVGILARNHRGFVMDVVATAKLGADMVFLNTGFAGPQLADVVAQEGIDTILHDDEYADIVAGCGAAITASGRELATMAEDRSLMPLTPTRRSGRMVILTSGTTGRPKGAARSGAGGGDGLTPLLSRVPLRARDTVVIAAPLFHAWGLVHMGVGLGMSSTAVLQPQFDPEATLAAIADNRANGLVVVPVMLQRILALDGETIARYDTSSLRYIASSGSALGATLATAAIRRFGPILYNIYGSTEVSLATIAGPDDLQAAPSTAGRPAPGSVVRIFDADGHPLGVDQVGRVFVGNRSHFDGYTGGGTKESIDGLLSSGDLGHFDRKGRLFIDGRDDDMIISGGENVFPAEVEDLLATHPSVAEAAVIGVADEEFGQRLKAFVVRRPGTKLTERQVKDHVRTHLARYKVPGTVVFIEALPRTTTGKLRRLDLREDGVTPRQRTRLAWMATSGAARLAATTPVDLLAMTRNPLVARSLENGIRAQADTRRMQAGFGCRRKADGAIHHHEGGSGPAVVLINGWTASGLVWPAAMVAELERDHRVVRIDNRGSGWSRYAPRPYTIGDLARDARNVIDRLGLDRPTVVGLSMGGMIAQELSMRWPERVGRLVLLGTRPPSPEDVAPPAKVTASLLSTPPPGMSLRTFLREGWATVAAPGFGRDHPEAVDEMARSIARRPTPRFAVLDQARALAAWHGAHRLRRIIVPTTVVHGAEDPLIPVRNGMRLAQLVPGARYVELPDVGHLVPYEAPSRVAAIIADRF